MMKQLALLLLVTVLAIAAVTSAQSIFSIKPNQGGIEGGTLLTIVGTGFSTKHSKEANVVYVGPNLCEVQMFYSSATTLKCVVPKSNLTSISKEPLSAMVRVIIDNKSSAFCRTNCWFTYGNAHNAQVNRLVPGAVLPESKVQVYGRLATTVPSEVTVSLGNNVLDTGSMSEDMQPIALSKGEDNLYGSLDGYGLIDVSLGNQVSGLYNISMKTSRNGYAVTLANQYVSAAGQVYQAEVVAEVQQISAHSGSNAGGLPISIKGKGFSSVAAENTVDVDGVPCTVTSASYNEIVCVTDPKSNATPKTVYRGNRAIALEAFNTTTGTLADLILNNQPDSTTKLFAEFETQNVTSAIGQKMKALFTPVVDGPHVFYVSNSDASSVFFSSDENSSNKLEIIKSTARSAFRAYFQSSSQISAPVNLVKGKSYYIEAVMKHIAESDHFSLAVSYPAAGGIPSSVSLKEVQSIKLSATVTKEVQRITFAAGVTGEFRATLNSRVTSYIKLNALQKDVALAMNTLEDMSSVTIVKKTDGTTVVELIFDAIVDTTRALIKIDEGKLVAGAASAPLAVVTRVVQQSIPLGGAFDVQYNGKTASDIPFNTTPESLKLMLQEALGVASINVYKESALPNYITYSLVFQSETGDIPAVQVNSKLTGTQPVVSVTERVKGSAATIFESPIKGDKLSSSHAVPQIHVAVNGVPAVVSDNANFEYSTALTPTITSITPSANPITKGTKLVIAGTGFTTIQGTTVTVGDFNCALYSATTKEIRCTLTDGVAGGTSPLKLFVSGKGYAAGAFTITAANQITAVYPPSGSLNGGSRVVISGKGFQQSKIVVKFNGIPAEVISATYDTIVCTSPPQGGSGDITATVEVSIGGTTSTGIYKYLAVDTPYVTGVSPTFASVTNSSVKLTISGNNFGSSPSTIVTVGEQPCVVIQIMATRINCILATGPFGKQGIVVNVPNKGRSLGKVMFERDFAITSVIPSQGSIGGGTEIPGQKIKP